MSTHSIIIDGVEYEITTELYNRIKEEVMINTDPNFANLDFYKMRVGKTYGKYIEDKIIEHFDDMDKSDTQEYDGLCGDLKIEIKSTRAVSKDYKKSNKECPAAYAIDVDCDEQMFLSTFQQIKPYCCDWFVFHVLYKNSNRYFLVPSNFIQEKVGKKNKSEDKIYMSPQHRGNSHEGAIQVEKFIEYQDLFEIPENITSLRECINLVKDRITSKNLLVT